MTAALVVDGLQVGGRRIEGFTATAGTVVGLLGGPGEASGLLDAIAGLRRPDAGTVLLDGTPPDPVRVGVMQQPARLFPELTAAENVAVPLLARGLVVDAGVVDRALASVALSPATRYNLVEQLSGGQQQRVAIARALVTGSPLLCLDEPVTELDEASVDAVWAAVREAAASHGVAVVATADRDLAARCDRVVEV